MSKAQPATVFIVDDDDAVRDSIAELVESIGLRCAHFASANEFLDYVEPGRAGCLVLDVRMPGMSGLALQQRLTAMGATIPIVVLTGHGDVPIAVEAMKAGAVDFLQKPYREQELLDSINSALALDDRARQSNSTQARFERSLASLTEREREVLDHLLAGSTSKQIARALAISPRTAEAHRSSLLRKFGVGSTVDLIRLSGASGNGQ